ncbi:hypothetical protein AB0H00_23445 [Nocardia sp. NPDC023852]
MVLTVQLLKFLSDAQLRRRTTAETNKVECPTTGSLPGAGSATTG